MTAVQKAKLLRFLNSAHATGRGRAARALLRAMPSAFFHFPAIFTAGGFQLPSMIEAGISFGQ